uniref:Uncharacterized protein n=1 Tax=Lygus hesperus TaxID=30085 RepID=A0A0A9WBI6_LYGHE
MFRRSTMDESSSGLALLSAERLWSALLFIILDSWPDLDPVINNNIPVKIGARALPSSISTSVSKQYCKFLSSTLHRICSSSQSSQKVPVSFKAFELTSSFGRIHLVSGSLHP